MAHTEEMDEMDDDPERVRAIAMGLPEETRLAHSMRASAAMACSPMPEDSTSRRPRSSPTHPDTALPPTSVPTSRVLGHRPRWIALVFRRGRDPALLVRQEVHRPDVSIPDERDRVPVGCPRR